MFEKRLETLFHHFGLSDCNLIRCDHAVVILEKNGKLLKVKNFKNLVYISES